LDAQVLLADVLDRPRAWILAHTETALRAEDIGQFETHLDQCASGVPLPYVLGWWEFYGRRFELTPAVLIPRPETELLVEQALECIRASDSGMWVADVGTGSGCIAVTLAADAPDVKVLATDRSRDALVVAERNASRYGLETRVKFVVADLLRPVKQPFNLICANLPYIPTKELAQLAVGKTEPGLALNGGVDGLEHIHGLLSQLKFCLAPGGLALLEMGPDQPAKVAAKLEHDSDWLIEINADYAGKDRLLQIRKRA
jgi:release factor glutamine methyltransferase